MNPERLRIVVLARAVAPWHGVGGLERHVADMTRHLVRRGVRVTLVTPPPAQQVEGEDAVALPGLDDALRDGRLETRFVPYVTFPFAGRRGTTILDRITAYPYFGRRAGKVAQRLVEEGRAQIVHGHRRERAGVRAGAEAGSDRDGAAHLQSPRDWRSLGAPIRRVRA